MQRKKNLNLLGTVLACALVTAPLFAQTEVMERVDATAYGTVAVENISGSVTVIGWDEDAVEVTGTLDSGVEELRVENSGDRVEIEVKLPRRSQGKSSANLEIRIPRRNMLDIETVSANISVEGVESEFDLESVSGSVTVDGGGKIDVESVSGNVQLAGAIVEADVETVSGRISIDARAVDKVSAESVSGKVELSAGLSDRAEVDIETVSGRVILTLPGNTAADFDLESFSGDIENALNGVQAERTSQYAPGRELQFSTGGSAEVEVTTHSGDIELHVGSEGK